jgi:cytochrome P450
MTVTDNASLRWDPYDVDIDTAPYETWRRLRDEAPVYYNDQYDFYALSRFADVQAAHSDPKSFISGRGTVLELMGSDLSGSAGMIIFLDPPEHDTLRALVSRAFTPKRAAALEERIRQVCRQYLDPHVGGSGFDYVRDFATQLPSTVISMLLGVPDEDREEVRSHIDTVFHIEPGVGMINDISFSAQIWLNQYIADQLEQRRRHRSDDLFTALVEAEITGEDGEARRLTNEEAAGFGNLLVSAGTETVARLLGWAAVVLADHPDQRRELAADPTLLPAAVDELLRYEPPSPVQGRCVTRDIDLHGQTIPAGAKALLLTGSAGRDERRYPDADRFDIHRKVDSHVSFGFGIHFCLGAALARMEGRIGLQETLARFPEWEVDYDRAQRQHTSTVRGWGTLPITY